jgi:signal transduction histidine kinase/CheY-like chemotaxis protein
MVEKIISRYDLSKIINGEDAFAIADKNQKIIWFNQKFKFTSASSRIKGKPIFSLFKVAPPSDLNDLPFTRSLTYPVPDKKYLLHVTILKKTKAVEGYLLRIDENIKEIKSEKEKKSIHPNQIFRSELEEILTLLVKENSIAVLAQEILIRAIKVTESQFGIIVFQDEKKQLDFLFFDPDSYIANHEEIKKELKGSFSFISKWLNINKASLIAKNIPSNIGFNLTRILQSERVIVSPCFFESNLLAVIITAKKEYTYSSFEISNVEQFASLLAFSISSIKTRELNDALQARLLQAQKLETIGKLSSGMAHDFSNLLSSIFGSLNLLKKRAPKTEDITRLLDNIENCSIRAKDLTKGLLSFGKPTPKRKELIKTNLLLGEISKVVSQTFPKHISFKTSIDDNLKDIMGNATEIYQVLLNLCVNAREAIDKSGSISLSASNITVEEKNHHLYPLLNKGNYVRFSVKDTGTGISEDHIQKIFDPYFSTKEKETGSGLGLYVTYGIVKAHNGHIEVSSELSNGTSFEVFIPAFEISQIKASAPDKIILLADDEVMLRDLLAELLEANGYTVIKVSTGLEAIRVLSEEIKVDLVIMDYNMPEMNGLDCISHIRELEFKIPIILSTGSMSLTQDLNLSDYGINGVLSKPYEFESMIATIQQLI